MPQQPQIGQKKIWPDGEVTVWDGQGWESTGEFAGASGDEAESMVKNLATSREFMAPLGAVAAGLAFPPSAAWSIPSTLGLEALTGILGGTAGAAVSRGIDNDPDEPSLKEDLGVGATEGLFTGGFGGSALNATGKGLSYVGDALNPWGRKILGASIGSAGGPVGAGVGGAMAEAGLNPQLIPKAMQKVGNAVRPATMRQGVEDLYSWLTKAKTPERPPSPPWTAPEVPSGPATVKEWPDNVLTDAPGTQNIKHFDDLQKMMGAKLDNPALSVPADPMSQARMNVKAWGNDPKEEYFAVRGYKPGRAVSNDDVRAIEALKRGDVNLPKGEANVMDVDVSIPRDLDLPWQATKPFPKVQVGAPQAGVTSGRPLQVDASGLPGAADPLDIATLQSLRKQGYSPEMIDKIRRQARRP